MIKLKRKICYIHLTLGILIVIYYNMVYLVKFNILNCLLYGLLLSSITSNNWSTSLLEN